MKWWVSSNMHNMWSLGQRRRGNPKAVWALSTTTTEATNREPQRVVTGATAALTTSVHSTAFAGGGASKHIMAVARPTESPTRSAKWHENQANRSKTQRIAQDVDDSCVVVAAPCVAFSGFLRPPKRD